MRFLPLILLSGLCFAIYRRVRSLGSMLGAAGGGVEDRSEARRLRERRLAVVLLAIVGCFIVSHTPVAILLVRATINTLINF